MNIIRLAVLLAIGVSAYGQRWVGRDDTQPKAVDCTQVTSPACKSLNEMIAAKDAEVIDAMKSGNALACFRDYEDKFFIFSFTVPEFESQFIQPPNQLGKASGFAAYTEFDTGTSRMSLFSFGNWKKLQTASIQDAVFDSLPKSEMHVSINSAEVYVQYKFPNVGGTTTNELIKIRRSTLRFSDTMEFPQVGATAARKGNPAKPQPPKVTQATFSGRCAKLN